MSTAMLLIGFLGAIACVVMLIVRAIKRDSLKPFAIGFAVCLALFMIGGATVSGPDDSENDTASKAIETEKQEEVEDSEKTPAPKPKRIAGTVATPTPSPESGTGTGPKKKPMSPSSLDSETSDETKNEPQETKSSGYSIMFGDLLDANPSGGVDGNTLVIKAKIHSQMTNKQTINQNYHNVEDIIKNQGGDQFNCIDYWAVADMSDGSEQKVVAFTVNSNVIQGVAAGNIVAIEFEDYVDDLFIHQSLR